MSCLDDFLYRLDVRKSMKLQADNLRVSRGNKEILHGLTFQVDSGEVYALLGGNGAGKSTTLLSFLGFIEPQSGSVKVNNQEVTSALSQSRAAIAYLPEAATLYEHMDARENLNYFLQLAGKHVASDDIEAALDRVALRLDARNQRLKGYSKGMRQKVAIALAILRDTDILLLDEPTSGLDPTAIDEFHNLVRALADFGKAILMVTHDVYGACHVADRIGLLKNGDLVGEFSAENGQSIDTEIVHRAFAEKDTV